MRITEIFKCTVSRVFNNTSKIFVWFKIPNIIKAIPNLIDLIMFGS
jgi:hypothetical protein